MKVKLWTASLICFCFILITVIGCSSSDKASSTEELEKIRVSHQPEFETFITYQAIQDGLDNKVGVELELVYFDSGMPQIEALPANQWDVGATGGVPMLMAALRYDAYLIGIADDESMANVVMARPDNSIFNKKNANGTYGTAEQITGKQILETTVSSGHYATSSYLKSLGLNDSDVKISNLEQAQAIAAFESGKGDLISLWAPFMYTGLEKGWKVVASGDQVGANIPLVLIANKKFADEHPEQVVKFLDIYFQGIDTIKKEGTNLTDKYQSFLQDWAGMDISEENASLDIDIHPVYSLEEQLAMFDSSNGPSEVQQWMQGIADFFTSQGKFTPEERDKVMNSSFVNDKFLRMLAEQKGLLK